ncbi:GroES-like protein [Dendrothele bispora CBS 962.96]|uniref:GroES-like protein n=1 Tax=Dendrothele bispora (strain CBS 962.96) TaxID=1314807 RepID=A0A4S8M9V1_DENBC|nr:GroES-like protein [Dendrothele bispora CBS 962.96]
MVYQGITFRGSSSGAIFKSTFSRDSLATDDVVIKITHSGLCGTDLHHIHEDRVLGHEGIGIVQDLGPMCRQLSIGDRVGWGFTYAGCGFCSACLSGDEALCVKCANYGTGEFDQGSLGSLAIKKERWLFRIPDGITSELACPLMCAGVSVFTPLIEYVKPSDRVGIVGIGGLGHLAIQFASKMGCDVVAFSGSPSKREETLALGAREFYAVKDVEDYTTLGLKKPLDALMICTPERLDLGQYYPLLEQRAHVISVTIGEGNITAPLSPTAARNIKIIGWVPVSRKEYVKCLDFCERNKIFPIIERFPMSEKGIMEAIGKLSAGKIRYRAVFSWI